MVTLTDDMAEEKKEKKRERTRIDQEFFMRQTAIKKLFSDEEGRSFIWWMIETSGAYGFNPIAPTPHETAFRCGAMQTGQTIMSELMKADPDSLVELIKEKEYGRSNPRSYTRTDPFAGADTEQRDYTELTDPANQYS